MITSGFMGRVSFGERPRKRVRIGIDVESTFQVEGSVWAGPRGSKRLRVRESSICPKNEQTPAGARLKVGLGPLLEEH